MVKVITIMDDVYTELYRLKRSKGMSFSEVLRFVLKERSRESNNIINLAGSVREEDIDIVTAEKIKRGVFSRRRYV
jgi:predicted CopG family antitoxin